MNNETIENVIPKSVKYTKDVEWRGGGGGKICMNIHLVWLICIF